MSGRRTKHLTLAGLAVLGLCTVSIPVTIAVVLSTTGASDALTFGRDQPVRHHASPARAVAALRCVPKRGYYALTFEDGPLTASTPRLVAVLRRANAVATFFDVGRRAAAHQRLVELQRSVGQVASHGYTHAPLPELSHARRAQELQQTAKVLDYPNAFFRPAYSVSSAAADADIRRSGLIPVHWTVDTVDTLHGPRAIVAAALRVKPGGILRLHEGADGAVAAVPGIVAGLARRGLCPGFLERTPTHVVAAKP